MAKHTKVFQLTVCISSGAAVVVGGVLAWRWGTRKTETQRASTTKRDAGDLPPLVPGGHWLLGHLSALEGFDRYDKIAAWAKEFGPTFRVLLPLWHRCGLFGLERSQAVFVMSKADQLDVMAPAGGAFDSRTDTDVAFGMQLFSGVTMGWHRGGRDHAERKKEFAKSMAPKVLKKKMPTILKAAGRFLLHVERERSSNDGSLEVQLQDEMVRIMVDLFAEAEMSGYHMGAVLRDGPGNEFLNDLDTSLAFSLKLCGNYGFSPLSKIARFLTCNFTREGRQASAATKRFYEAAATILRHHEQVVQSGEYEQGRDGINIAQVCAQLAKEGKPQEDCTSDLVNYLFSSHDTGNAVALCLHNLSFRPELQNALRQELQGALENSGCEASLAGLRSADPSLFFSADARLQLLNAVIKESMRLWPAPLWPDAPVLLPAAGMTWRSCSHDGALLGGFEVRKAWLACAPFYLSQRDESTWGKDAAEFRPERWLGGPSATPENAAYTPFANGIRGCPGQNLANASMRVILAMCVLCLDLAPAQGSKPTTIFALGDGGLPCRVTLRTSSLRGQ